MENLKPCPFCGGKASLETEDGIYFYVICDECSADAGSVMCYDKEEAITAWNNRTIGKVEAEEIKKMFLEIARDENLDMCTGIFSTLRILGIKIKGVNT